MDDQVSSKSPSHRWHSPWTTDIIREGCLHCQERWQPFLEVSSRFGTWIASKCWCSLQIDRFISGNKQCKATVDDDKVNTGGTDKHSPAIVGLDGPDSVVADIRPFWIKRNTSYLQKVVRQIEGSCNPFRDKTSDALFNIHTGKAASGAVQESLLSVPRGGKAKHKEFIDACIDDPSKFEEPIKKSNWRTLRPNAQ